jgi:hypothetical protein
MAEKELPASTSVAPGALTALLRDVFRSPVAESGAALPELRPGELVGRFELVRESGRDGEVVGRYEIVGEIGRGGFGVVYEARDRKLGRAVALKAVRTGGDVELKGERLLREAEAAAQLSHPNIVTLHDLGRFARGPYLVMELLRGTSLGTRLQAGALPVAIALRIGLEVAKALAHAHANGVVHRDLTPGNVFICGDGQVKVLDFGMAQAVGHRTLHGGTRYYMAPEQRRGAPEDERTDVFALGVMLYEMLTGRVPFPHGEAVEHAPRLEVCEEPAIGDLVARMLDHDPVKRPRDGHEVQAALAPLQEDLARRAAAGALAVRVRADRRVSRKAILAIAAAVVLGIVAVGLSSTRGHGRNEGRGPAATPDAATRGPLPTAAGAAMPASLEVSVEAPRASAPERSDAARARDGVRYCRPSVNAVPTPVRSSGDGVLTIDADPYGDVFVNGRPYGETPGECRLAADTYAVRVVHPQYGTREASITVRPGERTRWTAEFVSAP